MSQEINKGNQEVSAEETQPPAKDREVSAKDTSEARAGGWEKESTEDLRAIAKGLMVNLVWSLTELNHKSKHQKETPDR